MHELYPALKHHKIIYKIDTALGAGDFHMLMSMAGCEDFCDIFKDTPILDDDSEGTPSDVVPSEECGFRRRNLESWLQVRYMLQSCTTYKKKLTITQSTHAAAASVYISASL